MVPQHSPSNHPSLQLEGKGCSNQSILVRGILQHGHALLCALCFVLCALCSAYTELLSAAPPGANAEQAVCSHALGAAAVCISGLSCSLWALLVGRGMDGVGSHCAICIFTFHFRVCEPYGLRAFPCVCHC